MTEKLLWAIFASSLLPLLILFFMRRMWLKQDKLETKVTDMGEQRIQKIEDGCEKMQAKYDKEITHLSQTIIDHLRNHAR